MISPDRLLPQQEIYNFLRTITIKYDPIAQYLNTTLMQKGIIVDFEDPTTWKYYLNLTGQYHPSDTLMYVTSLDTRQQILFSPETLAKNLRTKAVYVPGGIYYNRLCDLYPEQVDLIKSILFPVKDIVKAINAPDLTLLGYGSGYLEDYEESVFIMQIEEFLDILKERWYFNFLDDEPYFYLTFWSQLWIYLAMLLMSGRMGHIKTAYVHSWDIWNELGAHGLDNYSDILDREKSMMLYQNIDYFKANAGKQSNLIILAERLLKSFGIGLYGRIVVQEAETRADAYQLTPQLVPVLLPSNTNALPAQIEIKTVATIQSEIFEKGLTPSNASEVVEAIERKLGDTRLNEFATKFLEIKPIAQNKPYAETLNMFLMETLIVSITQGYYTKPVEVLDPLTNDPIYLPPAELLALYNYAAAKAMGRNPTNFPTKVRLYRSFTTTLGTPLKKIFWYDTVLYLSTQVNVEGYFNGVSYDQNIESPRDFSDNVTALWLKYMEHMLADQNNLIGKRQVAHAYLASLCHKRREETISLVQGYANYDDWLGSGGIDIYSTIFNQYNIQVNPKEQWANLADSIITTLIPLNDILKKFGNFTLSDSGYERLRQLFVQMCSYRVVFLEAERDTAEFVVGPKWSTDYGPDDIQTFGEFTTVHLASKTDHSSITSVRDLHPGVEIDRVITTLSTNVVTKTSVTNILATETVQPLEMPKYTSFSKNATNMVQGPLNLYVTPMIPQKVEPV